MARFNSKAFGSLKQAKLFHHGVQRVVALLVFASLGSPTRAYAELPADLTGAVSALPATTGGEALKKSMLSWALEEAAAAEAAGQQAKSVALVADIRAALTHDIAKRAKAPESLFPPIPDFSGNPIAQSAVKAVTKLATSTLTYPKGPAGDVTRDASGWRFITITEDAKSLAFALCHPQSPLAGDPRLLAPMLRRFSTTYEYFVPGSKRLADFGISDNAAEMYLLVRTVYPDLILPSLREEWERAIATNTQAVSDKYASRFFKIEPGTAYPNADVRQINALLFASMLLGRADFRAAAEAGIKLQATGVYPDGGMTYIGLQNECFSYHGINIVTIARYFQVTADATALAILKATRNYYPLSIEPSGVAEYFTAPVWKPYWNSVTGNESALIIASLTRDPQNARVAALGEVKGNFPLAAFYSPDVQPAPAPDNYITYDRNTLGPRGRFGVFSFAGTTRASPGKRKGEIYDSSAENRGKGTYVGCMVMSPADPLAKSQKPTWPLSAALQDATVEVRLAPGEPTLDRMKTHAFISREDRNATIVSQSFATLTTAYRISAGSGEVLPWEGRQAWIMTPSRLVGLVELLATDDTTALSINGTLKFISGRGHWGTRKEFQTLATDALGYGALIARLHAQDFGALTTEYTDTFAGDAKKSGRVLMGGDVSPTAAKSFAKGTRRFYLVEIHPDFSKPAAAVTRVNLPNGLIGIELTEPGQHLSLIFNPTAIPVTFKPPAHPPATSTLHTPGEAYRAAWLGDPNPVPAPANASPSAEVSIPAYSHVAIRR